MKMLKMADNLDFKWTILGHFFSLILVLFLTMTSIPWPEETDSKNCWRCSNLCAKTTLDYKSWIMFIECIFFKRWANSGLFFVYFRSFQTTNIFFYNKSMWKNSCPSSIQRRDSNPWPSEHEPPPITTRPGLPPKSSLLIPSLATYNSLSILCKTTHNCLGVIDCFKR